MKSSENFTPSQTETENIEKEIAPKSPDAVIKTEISNEQIERYVADAEEYIEQQVTEILPETEQKIKCMNVSPETMRTARQEQGLDGQLNVLQSEADQFANEAKLDIKSVLQEAQRGESILGFQREDISGMIQKMRSKKNVRYESPDGEKFFSKYVNQQEGKRDNVAGLKKEKRMLDKLMETGVTPKVGGLKIYPNEKRARLIIENVPGASLDKMDDNQVEEFLKKKAESTIRSTADALDKMHKNGVLLIDINDGAFLLNERDNKIITHLVDFELAVDLNDGTADNFKDALLFRSIKDIGFRLDQEIDYQNSDILKKSEINLWARTLAERIIGFDDISKSIELPPEKQKEFNAAKEKISPILKRQITERARRDYQYQVEASKKDQSYDLPSEDYFIQQELDEELPRQIEKELIGFTLEEKMKTKGVKLSKKTLDFMSRALNPELKNRPTDFSEYLSKSEKEKPEFLYHGTNLPNIKEFEPRKRLIPGGDKGDVPTRVYAGDNPAFAAAFSFPWSTDDGFELSVDDAGKVIFNVPIKFKDRLNQPVYLYKMSSGQFKPTNGEGVGHSYHTENKVKPIEAQTFKSVQAAIENFGGVVKFYKEKQKPPVVVEQA